MAPRDPFVRVNAFVGFALPTAAANVLLSVQRRLAPRVQETGAQIRWVDPLHLHANLRHLGPVFPEHLEHLADALRAFAAETPSFPVRIGELLIAPSEGPPRALWAELEADGPSLATVREGIQATFEELGLSLPNHTFAPHTTVALIDALPDVDALLTQAKTIRGDTVARFWLSDLQLFIQQPPRLDTTVDVPYRVEASAPLRRRPMQGSRGRPSTQARADSAPTQTESTPAESTPVAPTETNENETTQKTAPQSAAQRTIQDSEPVHRS